MVFNRTVPGSVRVDGVELCQGKGVEHGVTAAFCAYFVFDLAYPPYMKKTLTFLQRAVLNITVVSDTDLPVTVIRMINLLLSPNMPQLYRCPRCRTLTLTIFTLIKLIQHVGLIHAHKSNLNVTCGLNDCISSLTSYDHYMIHPVVVIGMCS